MHFRFEYVKKKDIDEHTFNLETRFRDTKRIKQTRMHHYFEPVDENTMKIKVFSDDTDFKIVKL